jgi:hypothetical protein
MTGFASMQGSTSCAWNGYQAWIIHGLVDAQPMEGGNILGKPGKATIAKLEALLEAKQ